MVAFVDDETAFVISENIETQKNTVQLRWWRRYQRVSSASASFEFHHSALLVSAERNNAKQSQKTDNEQDANMNDFGDSVSFEIVRIFIFSLPFACCSSSTTSCTECSGTV